MSDLKFFMNDRMKVLQIIQDHQIKVEEKYVCPLNQQAIADLVPCSKLKVNHILRELINEGYIKMMGSKGRYQIIEKGQQILKELS